MAPGGPLKISIDREDCGTIAVVPQQRFGSCAGRLDQGLPMWVKALCGPPEASYQRLCPRL